MLLDRVQVNTSTTGTGTITLGTPTNGYQSWSSAGAVNGLNYSYLILDVNGSWEVGQGLYTAAGPTLTRPGPGADSSFESSTGSLLNLSGGAIASCSANANDYVSTSDLNNALATVQAIAVNANSGGTLANTSNMSYSFVGIDTGAVNVSSLYARWARFHDAGSVNDETTILTGATVSGIAITLSVSTATVKMQGRVWRRPLSSNSLNVAPGSAPDDVLIYDSGIVMMMPDQLSMIGSSQIFLNVPISSFIIQAGYTYGFDFQVFDSTNAVQPATARYTSTTALQQRFAGFYYANTAASSFSSQTNTRPFRIGYSVAAITSNIASIQSTANGIIAATADSNLLTDLERLAISRQGAWTGANKIIRPNFPGYRYGLSRLGLTDGTYGVDFGPRTAISSMTEMSTVPGVTLSAGQIRFGTATINSPQGAVYSSLKQIGSRGIYQPSSNWARLYLTDCYMDGQATTVNAVASPATIQLPSAGVTQFPYVEFQNCDFRYFYSGMGNIYNGAIRKCIIYQTGDNGISVNQPYDNGSSLIFEQNLIMYVATPEAGGLPANHADAMQFNEARSLSSVGNVYFMPSGGNPPSIPASVYDPGQYGTTNCIRHSAQSANPISNCYHLGELVIGGNSPVGLDMNGGTMVNMLFAFNKYGTSDYSTFNNFISIRGPQSSGITTDWCNLAFFDEYFIDGTPMIFGGTSSNAYSIYNAVPASYYSRPANPYRTNEEKWGIFNWDKTRATPKYIQALQLLGLSTGRVILDSNNDINPDYDLGSLKSTY